MYLSIHNVTKVYIDNAPRRGDKSSSRDLIIVTADGVKFQVTMFAGESKQLEVIESERAHLES